MYIKKIIKKVVAFVSAFSIIAAGSSLSQFELPAKVEAAAKDSRITVDIDKNDGRKASYARYAQNWLVKGENDTFSAGGLTFKISAGGKLRLENNKKLQLMSGIYPYLTMDGATVDTSSGGVIKLEISGLSAGTHSIKTWHSNTNQGQKSGTMRVKIDGKITQKGIACPTTVKDENQAGIGYSTFTAQSGKTVTVQIEPEGSDNAWLNAFEIDGSDPVNGISNITPANKEAHFDSSKPITWKAGKNAASYDFYIGTNEGNVFNATKKSAEYKGNITGTSYKLDKSYTSVPTYFWRVDTIDKYGKVFKGSVNSFNVARLAFPSAEGYGRFARGGQGGQVIHVTNLNDSGEGSLRWALCDSKWQTDDWKGVPRIIVFDVGGVISLKSTLCIPDNAGSVYIAGQTAPGDGITLINYDFGAMGTSDVIIRNVHVRVGDSNGKACGGMGVSSCNHTIIDHCSISWATDEGFSSRQAQNISFQWNIIGESLNNSVHYLAGKAGERGGGTERHAFAASIGGYTGSFHHNLLINNTGRNWSLAGAMEQDGVTYGGQLDISNNVVYNWRDRTTDGGVRRLDFTNNFYKSGAESNESLHVVSIDGNELGTNDMQKMYVSGNIMQSRNGSYILKPTDNAWDKGKAVSGQKHSTNKDVRSDTPFFPSYVNVESAENAYNSVIAKVGANAITGTGRDYIDARYINEVKNGKYTYIGSKDGLKGIIDSQNDVGGYPTSKNFKFSNNGATNSTNDKDRDGMPDAWEKAHGLNPNDATDGSKQTLSADGYTNVEMYLNELAGDKVVYNGKVALEPEKMELNKFYHLRNVNSGLVMNIDTTSLNVQQWGTDKANDNDTFTLCLAENGYYYIQSMIKDKTYVVDVTGGKTQNGTNIGVYKYNGKDNQKFSFTKNSDGSYKIHSKVSGDKQLVEIPNADKTTGANVATWEDTGATCQDWTLEEVEYSGETMPTDVKYFFTNVNSGSSMESSGSTDADGTNVWQWSNTEPNSTGNNIWTLKPATGDLYYIVSGLKSGRYLTLNQNNIEISAYNKGTNTQMFRFLKNPDGSYYIQPRSSIVKSAAVPYYSKVVEVANASKDNGANVAQWEINGNNCQKWNIRTFELPIVTTTVTTKITPNPTTTTTSAKPVTPKNVLGDANGDGVFDINDVKLIQKWLIADYKTNSAETFTLQNADIDHNGKLNALDLTLMKQMLVKG